MSARSGRERSGIQVVRLEVAGLTVRLTFGPGLEEIADEVATLWEHLRATDSAEPPRIALDYALAGRTRTSGTLQLHAMPSATYTVSGHITREMIRSLIGTRLLLHAGAVVHPELGTVLLVGASGAGKSTSATQLGRTGGYLTDELTILDPESFELSPYPKPVSRHDPDLGAKRDHALPDLGLHPVPGPPAPSTSAQDAASAPSMVVLLDRIREDEDGERSRAVRVPLPEALVRIVPQTSSLWMLPGGLSALAALLETTGGALEVRYREASELEELLRGAPPGASGEATEIEGRDGPDAVEDGQVAIAPFRQALAVEAGVFVLGRSEAVHLSGLAALVWDLLQDSGTLTRAELEEQIVQELGEHPESAALLDAALAELLDRGWACQG